MIAARIAGAWRRLCRALGFSRVVHNVRPLGSLDHDLQLLRSEGYLIVRSCCKNCGEVELSAIHPDNYEKPSQCGKCLCMTSMPIKVIE